MYSCAFFGHRDYPYENFEGQIRDSLIDLIENYEVKEFYCGARGDFDWLCAKIVYKLKAQYPFIKCICVWSYMPQKNERHPYFDGSVYLLEKKYRPYMLFRKAIGVWWIKLNILYQVLCIHGAAHGRRWSEE